MFFSTDTMGAKSSLTKNMCNGSSPEVDGGWFRHIYGPNRWRCFMRFPKQHSDALGHTRQCSDASSGCLRAAFVAVHLMTANRGQRGDCLASLTAAKSCALIRAQSLGQSGQTGCLLHPPGPFNYLPDGGLIQVGISHPIDNGASVSCCFSTHYQVLILSSVSCCPICPSPTALF